MSGGAKKILKKCNQFYIASVFGIRQDTMSKIADVAGFEGSVITTPDNKNSVFPARGVIYKSVGKDNPNLEEEWKEACRYEDLQKIGKTRWIEIGRLGKPIELSKINRPINNHDNDLKSLDKEKLERVKANVLRDEIEYPIVGRWPNGRYELIAGNTRIAVLKFMGHDPVVWLIDIPATNL